MFLACYTLVVNAYVQMSQNTWFDMAMNAFRQVTWFDM